MWWGGGGAGLRGSVASGDIWVERVTLSDDHNDGGDSSSGRKDRQRRLVSVGTATCLYLLQPSTEHSTIHTYIHWTTRSVQTRGESHDTTIITETEESKPKRFVVLTYGLTRPGWKTL